MMLQDIDVGDFDVDNIDVDDIDVDDIEDADDKDSMEWMDGVARYRKILHVCKLAAGAEEEKGRAAKGKYDLEV